MRSATGLTAFFASFIVLFNIPALGQTPSTSNSKSLVTLTMTVNDARGRLVGGLTRDDFTIVDEKITRTIIAIKKVDEPMDVGILVDISESMNSTELRGIAGRNQIVESLSTFVQLSNQKNRYFLMAFGNQPHLLSDWSNDIRPALSRFKLASAKGYTAFYDALKTSIEKVKTGTQRKRVVLVISDGLDSGSNLKPEEIRKVLRANDVLVYFLAVAGLPTTIGSVPGLPVPLESLKNARLITGGTQALIEFAEITGGRALLVEDDEQMNVLADQIATELRHQYRIEFETDLVTQQKWRRLKATMKPRVDGTREFRNLKLRVRQGYYSAADSKQ